MTKPHQDTEPFFITEEIAAEMIVAGYKFEPPPIACTMRLRDVLERMSDDELTIEPRSRFYFFGQVVSLGLLR